MAGDAGIELMAIAARHPFKTRRRGRFSARNDEVANVKGDRGQTASANYKSPFARKPQIPLAFVREESNGRDTLVDAQRPASYPPIGDR